VSYRTPGDVKPSVEYTVLSAEERERAMGLSWFIVEDGRRILDALALAAIKASE
jgi:hypothetical protein